MSQLKLEITTELFKIDLNLNFLVMSECQTSVLLTILFWLDRISWVSAQILPLSPELEEEREAAGERAESGRDEVEQVEEEHEEEEVEEEEEMEEEQEEGLLILGR